jgi:hypothetical protein
MTAIEDRLRVALLDAPTPHTSTRDPLADLERRVGRAQRRLSAIAIAVVAVLVAAVVVPLSMLSGTGGTTTPANRAPRVVSLQLWPGPEGSTSIAAGGGFVWTIDTSDPNRGFHNFLQRRDSSTGKVLDTYRIGDVEDQVVYGAGLVWTFGGGSQAEGSGDALVGVFGPTSMVSSANFGPNGAISGIVFAGGIGYAIQAEYDSLPPPFGGKNVIVAYADGDPTSAYAGGKPFPGARRLLAGRGTLFVIGRDREIAQYPSDQGWPPVRPSEPIKSRGLPIALTAHGFWVLQHGNLVQEDANGKQIGSAILLPPASSKPGAGPGEINNVVMDKAGGLYVGLLNRSTKADDLLYYSVAALQEANPAPTAIHHGLQDLGMAVDPAGGVVVNDESGFGRWNPAGS